MLVAASDLSSGAKAQCTYASFLLRDMKTLADRWCDSHHEM